MVQAFTVKRLSMTIPDDTTPKETDKLTRASLGAALRFHWRRSGWRRRRRTHEFLGWWPLLLPVPGVRVPATDPVAAAAPHFDRVAPAPKNRP